MCIIGFLKCGGMGKTFLTAGFEFLHPLLNTSRHLILSSVVQVKLYVGYGGMCTD